MQCYAHYAHGALRSTPHAATLRQCDAAAVLRALLHAVLQALLHAVLHSAGPAEAGLGTVGREAIVTCEAGVATIRECDEEVVADRAHGLVVARDGGGDGRR